MRKGAEVANCSSKYKEEKEKRHRRKGKTKENRPLQRTHVTLITLTFVPSRFSVLVVLIADT